MLLNERTRTRYMELMLGLRGSYWIDLPTLLEASVDVGLVPEAMLPLNGVYLVQLFDMIVLSPPQVHARLDVTAHRQWLIIDRFASIPKLLDKSQITVILRSKPKDLPEVFKSLSSQ